jgi:hypothetical protein
MIDSAEMPRQQEVFLLPRKRQKEKTMIPRGNKKICSLETFAL